MGLKRIEVRCTKCKKATALIGEDINKKYTIEFYTAQGWVFTKYSTMCPECKQKSKEEFERAAEQIAMDDQ